MVLLPTPNTSPTQIRQPNYIYITVNSPPAKLYVEKYADILLRIPSTVAKPNAGGFIV